MTKISATINMAIPIIQKLPILASIICKWPISSRAPPTNLAARPKNVFVPVPITKIRKRWWTDETWIYILPIASASPCLQVEPENISSPMVLLTGSDSPVNAAWSMETPPCATTTVLNIVNWQTQTYLIPTKTQQNRFTN